MKQSVNRIGRDGVGVGVGVGVLFWDYILRVGRGKASAQSVG